MALQKAFDLPTGVSGNYWRIDSVTLAQGRAIVRLGLYLSMDAAKMQKKQPMFSKTVLVPYTDKTVSPYATAYAAVKAKPDFSGSTDV